MNPSDLSELNRRDFLKGGSFATLISMLGGVELLAPARARAADLEKLVPFQINCGLIGLGVWGREILATLGRLKTAKLTAICDTYPAMLRRSAAAAPAARQIDDYRKIIDDKEIKAVIVATPTHQHREIVLAALQAGKHVYCESPLAHTLEEARAIAQAARAASKQVFQVGQQTRSDPQRHFLLDFIRAGAMGRTVKARAQWHKKTSWRHASPNPDREKEINWRLSKNSSLGLIGEIGIHQLDALVWFLGAQPLSVTGFGSLAHWRDGREIPDAVQAVFEFPEGVHVSYECTLTNSFDADYEIYYGTDAAIMVRGSKAWMFKEVDSPLLGWEVYARKETFYKETGIALIADATKLSNVQEKAAEEPSHTNTTLHAALDAFLNNVNTLGAAVEDFSAAFDASDKAALQKYLADLKFSPAANCADGYAANVLAIKANEAVVRGGTTAIPKEMFELG